ncbi:unnamed protein product, partial [Symbiodinium necroappetens]
DSAISPTITLHASLWKANGEVKYDTATFTSPASKFGNSNGTLVPEGEASEGTQGTGSWEKSAISARFFLKCQLRTCGRFARTIYQEIFPWQAYSNQDGYLVPSNPPPPPPACSDAPESWTNDHSRDGGLAHSTMQSAPSAPATANDGRLPGIWGAGQEAFATGIPDIGTLPSQGPIPPGTQATFSSPVQSAIRNAASSLSAAISFAQDMEQSMPLQTHSSLAQSLRVTSDILREVSEELIAVARNQSSSTAPDTATEAEDRYMAPPQPFATRYAAFSLGISELAFAASHDMWQLRPGSSSREVIDLDHPTPTVAWPAAPTAETWSNKRRRKEAPGPSSANMSRPLSELDKQRQESVATALQLYANPKGAGIKLTDNPFTHCPTENLATSCLHSKWAPFEVFGRLLDGLPSMQDSRHSSPSIVQPPDYKSIFFGAYSQGPLVGLRAQTRRYPMVSRLLNAVIYTLSGDVPNGLIPLSVFSGGQLFVEAEDQESDPLPPLPPSPDVDSLMVMLPPDTSMFLAWMAILVRIEIPQDYEVSWKDEFSQSSISEHKCQTEEAPAAESFYKSFHDQNLRAY